MLQPSCHPNSTLCTVTVHQSLVDSLFDNGWNNNRSSEASWEFLHVNCRHLSICFFCYALCFPIWLEEYYSWPKGPTVNAASINFGLNLLHILHRVQTPSRKAITLAFSTLSPHSTTCNPSGLWQHQLLHQPPRNWLSCGLLQQPPNTCASEPQSHTHRWHGSPRTQIMEFPTTLKVGCTFKTRAARVGCRSCDQLDVPTIDAGGGSHLQNLRHKGVFSLQVFFSFKSECQKKLLAPLAPAAKQKNILAPLAPEFPSMGEPPQLDRMDEGARLDQIVKAQLTLISDSSGPTGGPLLHPRCQGMKHLEMLVSNQPSRPLAAHCGPDPYQFSDEYRSIFLTRWCTITTRITIVSVVPQVASRSAIDSSPAIRWLEGHMSHVSATGGCNPTDSRQYDFSDDGESCFGSARVSAGEARPLAQRTGIKATAFHGGIFYLTARCHSFIAYLHSSYYFLLRIILLRTCHHEDLHCSTHCMPLMGTGKQAGELTGKLLILRHANEKSQQESLLIFWPNWSMFPILDKPGSINANKRPSYLILPNQQQAVREGPPIRKRKPTSTIDLSCAGFNELILHPSHLELKTWQTKMCRLKIRQTTYSTSYAYPSPELGHDAELITLTTTNSLVLSIFLCDSKDPFFNTYTLFFCLSHRSYNSLHKHYERLKIMGELGRGELRQRVAVSKTSSQETGEETRAQLRSVKEDGVGWITYCKCRKAWIGLILFPKIFYNFKNVSPTLSVPPPNQCYHRSRYPFPGRDTKISRPFPEMIWGS
ncbi:hypothetical protein VP01_2780g1 [Puccinia sorghi]|uniref:Uncharacterized protein n=1 Tax=Puccinia sorghi TaxID=27349 RepID=A0A0L6V2Q1_9BASI|nr:hypothetical protein VP01_2780g1 [Puccinia sorghi]